MLTRHFVVLTMLNAAAATLVLNSHPTPEQICLLWMVFIMTGLIYKIINLETDQESWDAWRREMWNSRTSLHAIMHPPGQTDGSAKQQ